MSKIDHEFVRKLYAGTWLRIPPETERDDVPSHYLRDLLEKYSPSTILDAGCGNGRYALMIARDKRYKVYACDLFDHLPSTKGFYYERASIDKLPYPDQFFDLVYSLSVIFYLENPQHAIQSFFRVLKPGGHLLITAHTKYSFFTFFRMLKRSLGLPSVAHLRGVKFYSAATYQRMMNEEGFAVLRVDGYRLSMFFYPAYLKMARFFKNRWNIILPTYVPTITRPLWLSRIKSIVAYHSILVGEKVN